MARDAAESPFFRSRRKKGAIVVTDAPKFDLESYISNYHGCTRLQRLHHIGSHSTYFAVDAYRAAIAEASRGKNLSLLRSLQKDLAQIAPRDPAADVDAAWSEEKTRSVRVEQSKLEHELKSYKNNLIKESIRIGHEDLGHFYYACGDYGTAHRAYMGMREHCTSNKQLVDMTLHLISTSIAQKTWLGVQAHIGKIDTAQLKADEKARLQPILSAVSGLAHLGNGGIWAAARSFLYTSPAFLTMEPTAGITWQKEVLTGNDVAVYGGLCALASMDRAELQNQVLGNNGFRNFLELEPHIRRAINLFCNSKYSACLEVLESYRNDYLLDLHLSQHVASLYSRIRTKSIVQYFIPFSCVMLDEMATKFQPTGGFATIEDELETMINNGTLDARIDLVDRLLISPPTNPRYSIHADALAMAERYDHTMRLRLTRVNMAAAGFEIKPEKGVLKDSNSSLGEVIGASFRGMGQRMGFN